MHGSRFFPLFGLALAAGACNFFPTGEEIEEDLERRTEQAVRSAAGPWSGTSEFLTLSFQLQEGAGSAVSGTGTMKETATAATTPITLVGSYQRPQLELTIRGMVLEGRQVEGAFQGAYTSFVGISAPLVLTAPGYSRSIETLMQEPLDGP